MPVRVPSMAVFSASSLLKFTRGCSRCLVTTQEINAFQDKGAICLRGVFRDWVENLKRGIAANHKNPSEMSEWLQSEDSETFYFNDFFNWRKIPEFVFKSPAAEVAGKLMKSEFSVFYHEHVFTKDPGADRATPWHQDQAYYPVDGWKNCSFWLPVTSVTTESCVKFVSGSHKWGKRFIPKTFDSLANYEGDDKVSENVPDMEEELEKYKILSWNLEPGDCIAFHMLTLHGAKQSVDAAGRQVFVTRWLGEDATLTTTPWATSPPLYGGLKPGESFHSNGTFPIVWRAKC
ncbi:PREDICTED: uncharacterized protein LOC107356923 isoform X3 [Acropora digitifera]|uniref:uncharacterized protein LOC107356923 isoform X3 n=1 Tax=Acropora digitifera TaxID=70779 RepID=UPI00077A1793|nr:PREDICTED: uncharacterized protein LOC107356923 isoform X3 [Acropora digitifera]